MLVIYAAVAAGSFAFGGLLYVAIRWLTGH